MPVVCKEMLGERRFIVLTLRTATSTAQTRKTRQFQTFPGNRLGAPGRKSLQRCSVSGFGRNMASSDPQQTGHGMAPGFVPDARLRSTSRPGPAGSPPPPRLCTTTTTATAMDTTTTVTTMTATTTTTNTTTTTTLLLLLLLLLLTLRRRRHYYYYYHYKYIKDFSQTKGTHSL